MHKLISISILLLTLFSCSEKEVSIPDEIIPREQMVQILADIHIAEATANYKSLSDTTNVEIKELYAQIFNKYSVSSEQYKQSYDFYLNHPTVLNKIYDQVINELSKRQSEVQNP